MPGISKITIIPSKIHRGAPFGLFKRKSIMKNIEKDKIIKIIEIFFPNAKIYLFGSRARGNYDERSDLDIAIDAGQPMSILDKSKIFTMIDALNMPQKTDLVDFQRASSELQSCILREGVLWKS